MDPFTKAIIIGASAALQDTAKEAVKDTYQALKQALTRWFGHREEARAALERIQQNPDDPQAQHALEAAVASQQQAGPPQEDLLSALNALIQAIQQHGQPQEQQRIGVLIEALKTKDLKFGHVQPPSQAGIGVKIGTAEAESITFGNIGSVGEP